MNSNYASVLESDLRFQSEKELPTAKSGIGILIDDFMNQRLVESASLHLDVEPVLLNKDALEPARLADLELIIADQPLVATLRGMLEHRQDKGEGVIPGVIAIVPASEASSGDATQRAQEDQPYDGVLALPQQPAQLAAQLSLLLYAHRAYARRYQDALEELHLNRRIFRSVTSGISVANAMEPDIPLTYVNPAFEAMTGYALEEVVGKNCRFLQGDERAQPAITLIREAIAAKREVTVVLKNFRKDGSCFWNELSLSPIRNREGEVTHFVGIQTDVTARVEFEDALRVSEKLAAVGRLASSIAHEINNPLESVMNLVYLAKLSDDPAETKTYLSTADSELQRVKLITTQSLRFFKQSTKPQAVGCKELVDSVLNLYQSRLQNAQVTVVRRDRATESIICMESEIRQVLNNLVSNAIDAMIGAGGRLLIRTRRATEQRTGAEGVMVTVSDTGHGIDGETLKSIYKAFYTTKGIGGTGLGLWISSEIVERHHGRLMVRSSSKPGHSGTTFALFLPYQGLGS
jgi:two-component system sporulation sensor kinase C